MSQRSMVDIAYAYAKEANRAITFQELWNAIKEELNLSEEEANKKIGVFYTELSLDCRFHCSGDNTWVLRSSLSFDEATADIFFVKGDLEEESEEDEDEDEDYEDDEDEEDEERLDDSDEDESLDEELYDNDEDGE